MALQKVLTIVSGVKKLVTLAISSSAGSGDADKIPALDANGRLDTTFMPVGIGAPTASILASEALTAGNWVNVYNNTGTPNVRKADATVAGKECNGFVLANVNNAANATVYFDGINTQCTSLTAGLRYFLNTTAGGEIVQASAPSALNNIQQELGEAISTTAIVFQPKEPITIAA